ncbi:right-handed parallel beta-helix repeat-containing protein [Salinimicrobium soli]|uniref:right-handed parallel beta-helix repeat-containing protein n=1 Tax=Salinimicrobium soli TaxID=1254399 RepID=UPI003AB06045
MKQQTTPRKFSLLKNKIVPTGILHAAVLFLVLLLSSCSAEEPEVLNVEIDKGTPVPDGYEVVYKGIFASSDSKYRGTLDVVFPDVVKGNITTYENATVKLYLSTGETFEARSSNKRSQNKSGTDQVATIDSQDLSFKFFLDDLGKPVVTDVVFKDQSGSVLVAEHTADSPVTPITGTYKCTNCQDQTGTYEGIPLNNEDRVFNMLLTDDAGEKMVTVQAFLGTLIDAELVVEETCTTNGDYTFCTLKNGTTSGDPVTWSGVHRYSNGSNGEACSTLSGKLSFISPSNGVIDAEFISDTTCPNNPYYVSSTGNDQNTGLSPEDAWRTIDKVNTRAINPGDAILFEGGQSFQGTLKLTSEDGNNSASPVRIGSYGNGKATILAGDGLGIDAYNTSGFLIENLIIAGSGMNSNQKSGIQFYNDLPNDVKLDLVEIKNCEVYGFRDFGIVIGSWNHNSGYSNVLIENNKVHDILDVGISSYGEFSSSKVGYAHSNLTVRSCEVYNIPGYSKGSHSGNGILLSDVQNSTIEHSTVHDSGSGNTNSSGGPVGIWYWDSDQVTIQFNEVYNMKSSTKDGGGFDFDGGVTNGVMQYNYSHDNYGGGFMIGQFSGARPMHNIVVRFNISENDAGTNGGSVYLFNGTGVNDMTDIDIYSNTLYLSEKSGNSASANIKLLNWKPISNNINIHNNILVAENGADLIDVPSGYDANISGNLYHTTGTFRIKFQGTVYSSLADFRTTGNEMWETQAVGYEGDPLLIAPGEGGTIGFGNKLSDLSAYKLNIGSPAIDTGVNFTNNAGNRDFFGKDLSSNVFPEIGAHAGLSSGDSSLVSN